MAGAPGRKLKAPRRDTGGTHQYPASRKSRAQDPMTRFDALCSPDGDCLMWRGSLNHAGYGQFTTLENRTVRAHRWIYEQRVGPIPDGLTLDHTCGRPACQNVRHLEPVTTQENTRRRDERRKQKA